eukprot:TRINITY_DN2557_c0_g1_i2.p1 TRINITY_DN2557_c0_g1~~TRINITY_DN2557_c0_g1_i2.p1  ORF type:complete len:408 (+),score=83.59 TRINITY_DN2557_c0_g1_i2:322-1545(+)
MNTQSLEEVAKILVLDEQGFLQIQLKKANELGDKARGVRLTIALKDLFFKQFGKMFVFEQFGHLRTRDAFSKAKLFGREALRDGMLKWSKQPLPTSLTDLFDPLHIKQATRLFKNILGYMGDRPCTYPDTLAVDLMQQGLDTPIVRDEIYCQLIKQLTDNPDSTSVRKGWTLMACCLQTFPPSDEFVNFAEMFLQQKGAKIDDFVSMLHDIQYGDKLTAPPKYEAVAAAFGSYKPVIDLNKLSEIASGISRPPPGYDAATGTVGTVVAPMTRSAPAPIGSAQASAAGHAVVNTTPTPVPQASTPQPQSQPQQTIARPPPPSTMRGANSPMGTLRGPPKQVTVLYDYDGGGNPKRLVIKKGDIITVLKEYDAGWALGRLDGAEGLFPMNYTKVLAQTIMNLPALPPRD